MGNAAWAAGMSLLMLGDGEAARTWLLRSADRYRESWLGAPPESWGRPIGAMKSRLIAGDREGACDDARWALAAGAVGSESPIGRYAATLAQLVLGKDADAASLATTLANEDGVPAAVVDALSSLAASDASAYGDAIRALVDDFESREQFLEGIPVADTVLALQALAGRRRMAVDLRSPMLPD